MKASLGIGKSLLGFLVSICLLLLPFSLDSSRKAELRWYLNIYLTLDTLGWQHHLRRRESLLLVLERCKPP